MVTVPTYQRDVSLRPIFQQDLAAQATPEAFGADIGRGMQSVARGVDQAAAAMAQVQDLEDTMRAKEADNAYAEFLRNSMYGDKGFMTLEGRNAIDARKSFEAEADKQRSEFSKGLSAQAARKYDAASQQRLQSVYAQSIEYTARERKTWFKESSAARVQTFADDALANFSNPGMVQKNIAGGLLEIRESGAMQGWSADTLKLRETEFTSGVYKNIALRVAQSDPLAAVEYMRSKEKQMTAAHVYDLNSALEGAVIEEEAKRETQSLTERGRKVSEVPGDIVAEVAGVTNGGGGPRRSKAFLSSISQQKDREGDTLNLDDAFADNLAALIQDAPPEIRDRLGLMSAYRSNEVQKRLFANSDGSGRNVAFPAGYTKPDGSIAKGSNHLHGRAVDLSYDGKSLKNAPKEVIDWVQENAAKYNMFFPMDYEPWHIEPTRDGTSSTVAARNNRVSERVAMPSYDEVEDYIAGIKNPKVADLVRRRFNAQIEAQSRAATEREKAAKSQLWSFIDQGGTPDQLPPEVKRDAGLSAVNSAWEYIDKQAKRQEVVNDETLMYDMRRYAAMDPQKFAEVDLNDYRDRLSKEAIKELTGLQTGALTDQRKAKEEGVNITTAFSQAQTQLEAVGLTTTGKEGSDREEAARRLAQFQNQLAQQMEEFKKDNGGRVPGQVDIQQMINRMLLPVVMKQPKSSVWGMTVRELWGVDDGFSETQGLSFELGDVGALANGAVVEPSVTYKDIPPRDRVEIEVALETQLGRKPSPEEVEGAYRRFLSEAR